jgi:hypothetical protein
MDPEPLELLAHESGDPKRESKLHKRFADLRLKDGGGREWFRCEGAIAARIHALRQ